MAKKLAKPSKPFLTLSLFVNNRHEEVEFHVIPDERRHNRFTIRAVWRHPSDPTLNVTSEGTDIERVKTAITNKLEKNTEYEWQRVLLVTLDSELDDSRDFVGGAERPMTILEYTAKIELEICEYQIATRGKEKVHRRADGSGCIMNGWPQTGPRRSDDWSENDMQSFIPDTPENRAALEAIITGFRQLRDKLSKLLHPDQIGKSLEKIARSGFLLTGPKEGNGQ